jgi:Holliday junction DNA helicase RuvB
MAIIPTFSDDESRGSSRSSGAKRDAAREKRPPLIIDEKIGANAEQAPEPKPVSAVPRRSTVLSANETKADQKNDLALRPGSMQDYVGQTRLKAMLQMSISAAKSRAEALDHVLFYGPPGLGKTTLARVIANEMNARIHMTSGPSLERPRDIIGLVHQLEKHDVLFIDEIHRLSRVAEELLYPAIEDFVVDLTSGKGHATRTMRLSLPRFTLVGATTKAGMISNALRDRFGFVCRLEFYSQEELSRIIARTSGILKVTMTEKATAIVASRSRGTPRIANRLVRLVRDYGQYSGKEVIDEAIAVEALNTYQIDAFGLDPTDRRFLEILIDNYAGGPVGIDTIAATLGEDSDTLEDVYEPFLIQSGFIQRTPRGRIATPTAYSHLRRPHTGVQMNLNFGTDPVT